MVTFFASEVKKYLTLRTLLNKAGTGLFKIISNSITNIDAYRNTATLYKLKD